jgi:hypothetical protein
VEPAELTKEEKKYLKRLAKGQKKKMKLERMGIKTFQGDFDTEETQPFSSWEYLNPHTEMNPHTEAMSA